MPKKTGVENPPEFLTADQVTNIKVNNLSFPLSKTAIDVGLIFCFYFCYSS